MGFTGRRIFMAKAEFPSNSHSSDARLDQIAKLKAVPEPVEEPEEKTEEAPEKEVFEGKISVKRKKIGPRLKSMFFDEGQSFADHILENVIVPRMKDIGLGIVNQIVDNIKRGVEDVLFPNGSSTNDVRSSRGSGPISYNNLHRTSTTIQRSGSIVQNSRPRQSNRVEDVLFEYRSDAQKALTFIESQIEEYGHCTLGDFYDYVDPSLIQNTDDKWGWAEVRRAYISEVGPNEFRLILPEPRPIHRR
jgi:hypothetical protein